MDTKAGQADAPHRAQIVSTANQNGQPVANGYAFQIRLIHRACSPPIAVESHGGTAQRVEVVVNFVVVSDTFNLVFRHHPSHLSKKQSGYGLHGRIDAAIVEEEKTALFSEVLSQCDYVRFRELVIQLSTAVLRSHQIVGTEHRRNRALS